MSTPRSRFLIIHNPASGRRRGALLAAVENRLSDQGLAYMTIRTEGPGHAAEIAAKASMADWDCVAAAGGDGTVNEVLNGLQAAEDAPPMGLIPLGTANVLAIEIGLSMRGEASARAVAECLSDGEVRPLHPGIVRAADGSERAFAMTAGAGLDARAVAAVSDGQKRIFGKGAYVLQAVAEWLVRSWPDLDVAVDGERLPAKTVVAANGRHYAGPFLACGRADITAPGFEALLLGGGRLAVLGQAFSLASGELAASRSVLVKAGESIVIDGPAGQPVQADGDIVARLPVRIFPAARPIGLIRP